jgi:hypothetical protein
LRNDCHAEGGGVVSTLLHAVTGDTTCWAS